MAYSFRGIKFSVTSGLSPNQGEIAITYINELGSIHPINEFVINNCGYEYKDVQALNLNPGFALLERDGLTPILFIVALEAEVNILLLAKNIMEALKYYQNDLRDKRIWIPLLGDYNPPLDISKSFEITFAAIQSAKEFIGNASFLIGISNIQSAEELTASLKVNSNVIDLDVFDDPDDSRSKNQDWIDISQFDLNSLLYENSSNYYMVGHIWGPNDDQSKSFFSDKIWEDDHTNENESIINSIGAGDILIMKSSFAKKNINYLRIKAIGRVTVNPKNGRKLHVSWFQLKHSIDIERMGKYRRTIEEIKKEDLLRIFSSINKEQPEVVNRLWERRDYNSNEWPIDRDGLFVYGQNIGREILDYNLIILPKSSYGGVGINSISTHILDLLEIDTDTVSFSEDDLLINRYKIQQFWVENWKYSIIFVITRDESKNYIPFQEQLLAALEVFQESEYYSSLEENLTVFIPFLGTGQAGMPYDQSWSNILTAIQKIKSSLKPKKIRINYPRQFDQNQIIFFNNLVTTSFNVQPNSVSDSLGNNEESELIQDAKDNIPFHLDNVETVDRLNREPVAKSLARLINQEIFDNKNLQYSFMIHLQGEWGKGKTTFLNLVEKHLNSGGHDWMVIKYNAWQNQHIKPPWWSLINQVYKQSKEKFKWYECFSLSMLENYRRIMWYSGWHKIIAFIVSVLLIVLLINFRTELSSILSSISKADEDFSLTDLAKLILAIGSIAVLFYSFSRFISTPFFMKSSIEAKSFLLRASDPMNQIKKHFNNLIGNINYWNYDVAIFIDDIDRCNKEYTISLLEGIQTLFREERVLYVIAGDKNWISTCFQNNYQEFTGRATKIELRLGDLFLEKIFQLSMRLPNISDRTKQLYWNHILGIKEDFAPEKSVNELTTQERNRLKQKVKINYAGNQENQTSILTALETEYDLTEQEVSDLAIEALDESKKDIQHLFSGHFNLINPNPRRIKRLANNYTMNRNTLIAERKEFSPHKLFRWLIIEDLYPNVGKELYLIENMDKVEELEDFKNLDQESKQNLLKLLFDKSNEHGGPLKKRDVKVFLGL